VAPIEPSVAELVRPGPDGALIACGAPLADCVQAAEKLSEEGVELAVINARFVKPLDVRAILRAVREQPFVLTVEEGCLAGGFGSAVLEAANAAGLETSHIRRLGLPDCFVEHADRGELLADLGLTCEHITETCRNLAGLEPSAVRPPSGSTVRQ
jgi:1-deoxy-D-xylulose-5-phosphate synthase